ncbi:MAG: hypothetical protein KGO49_04630 [Gammaproteobacteria bacterium]|nr:hypothetical protein [Gammaproteobacteria bacterium]
MPLQNRIDPWGQLNADIARGSWMGNRGILHDEKKEIVAPWRHKSWVTCRLSFQSYKREIFSQNNYSELFFLDEATAFSAGHRPCAECRRDRFNEFKLAWCKANPDRISSNLVSIKEIDTQLHIDRATLGKQKNTYRARFQDLPEGTFIDIEGKAHLLWNKHLYLWSFSGYTKISLIIKPSTEVTVLTPHSIINMLHQGFTPQVHESVNS